MKDILSAYYDDLTVTVRFVDNTIQVFDKPADLLLVQQQLINQMRPPNYFPVKIIDVEVGGQDESNC